MKVKEAIEWLEWARRQKFAMWHGEVGGEPFENIIELLQRGYEFEKMWEEGKKRLSYGFYHSIEQKYFPKKGENTNVE